MFGQYASFGDLPTIGALILLEGLLSADNAMVLAIMVRHLPDQLQKRALVYGLGGALILRTIMIAAATLIIQFWWLQLLGALYLVYLPIKHFIAHASEGKMEATPGGFWMTVLKVEMVDVAFALDSVLAGVALVNTARHPEKTWVVIAGGVLGVVILRFAAGAFIRLLNRYPVLDHMAYALVGWAGAKMLFVSGHTYELWHKKANPGQPSPIHVPEMPDTVFWAGMLLITGIGVYLAWKRGPQLLDQESEETAHEVEEILGEGTGNDPVGEQAR